jgi:hypothetical protein
VGAANITIRDVSFFQRTFSNSGMAQSLKIAAPQGTVLFAADQHYAANLTSISHQMSTDGVHYTGIVPGQQIDVGSGGFWYRASITTVDMGNGVLQRSINLMAASGTITLKETPLGGTLMVYQGKVVRYSRFLLIEFRCIGPLM